MLTTISADSNNTWGSQTEVTLDGIAGRICQFLLMAEYSKALPAQLAKHGKTG